MIVTGVTTPRQYIMGSIAKKWRLFQKFSVLRIVNLKFSKKKIFLYLFSFISLILSKHFLFCCNSVYQSCHCLRYPSKFLSMGVCFQSSTHLYSYLICYSIQYFWVYLLSHNSTKTIIVNKYICAHYFIFYSLLQ